MAVDSLRETRHINRISTRDLSVLWSAQSYRPEITAALRRIRSMAWRPLAQLCTNAIGPGPHPTFTSPGHPCLKTKNVLGVVIDASDVDFVAHSDVMRWPHYCIEREDLALNVTGAGSIGRVGMYFGEDSPLTNQHLARLSIAPGADAAFVCAFLSSWWGERALEQGISGSTGQLNLVNDHIRQVPVPVPDLAAQRYIGDKVRQAARLRERARILDAKSKEALAEVLGESEDSWVSGAGPIGLIPSGGFRTRIEAARIRGRLDPAGYHPELTAISNRSAKSQGFVSLSEIADLVTDTRARTGASSELSAYISVLHVLQGGYVDMLAAEGHRPDSDGRICTPGDVLLSGINPAANRIGVCPEYSGPIACSPEFSILHARGGVDAHYLAFALRSQVCFRQLLHLGQGTSSSRRRLDEAEFAALWVPICPQQQLIGRWIAIRQACVAASYALIDAARLLVDRLIEGSLDETVLISAQSALQCDNRCIDRVILQSLRRNADAAPLILDLDGLYALLDESGREND